MKPTCLLFGAVLLIGGSIAAPAAVRESDFPPRTVRRCAAGQPLVFHSPLCVRHQVRR